MSLSRKQALIEAPLDSVWELVGNPRRFPEWWPRIIEVRGDSYDSNDDYPQVISVPLGGPRESIFTVDKRAERADMRELQIRCTKTGTFFNWACTEAQGSTFLDVEFGMRPIGAGNWVFDKTMGRIYFRSWMESAVDALAAAAATRADPGAS